METEKRGIFTIVTPQISNAVVKLLLIEPETMCILVSVKRYFWENEEKSNQYINRLRYIIM